VGEERRYYVVVRKPGAAWDHSRSMREQDGWQAHADFMDGLAEEGFVRLGGPIGDGNRFLHVIDAVDGSEIERRLDEDPWADAMLVTASIEPWTILLRAGAAP
jgi:hypothetical protein